MTKWTCNYSPNYTFNFNNLFTYNMDFYYIGYKNTNQLKTCFKNLYCLINNLINLLTLSLNLWILNKMNKNEK